MDTSIAQLTSTSAAAAPPPVVQTKQASPPTSSCAPHAIAPCPLPWLRHDNFMTVKKVCTADGLMQAKKHSVVRVLQELKKGRTLLEKQLSQMELQLLHVSDYLHEVAGKLDIVVDESALPVADGDAPSHAGAANGVALANGIHGKGKFVPNSDKSDPLDPEAALVEEDLASETPCTTVGLWRYLSCFAFFKNVTLEDMQEALLLEDPVTTAVGMEGVSDANDIDMDNIRHREKHLLLGRVDALPALDEIWTQPQLNGFSAPDIPMTTRINELLKMRLLAAMIPSNTSASDGNGSITLKIETAEETHQKVENGASEKTMAKKKKVFDESEDVEMVSVQPMELLLPPCRTLQQLRDIGLVESSTNEIVRSLVEHPHDDEVSSEIRLLESELVDQVRRNNEFKRSLRRTLEKLKPWLTHDDEIQQIETKFVKMWRRKKELQRKKKHRVKKQMRKEASTKSAFALPPPLRQTHE